jgi:hypothetical protein
VPYEVEKTRKSKLWAVAVMTGVLGACAASPPVNPGYVSLGRPAPPGAIWGAMQGGFGLVFFDGREKLGGFAYAEGFWGFTVIRGATVGIAWSTF